jgi:predicted RNA-binding Zn-ribbon protein involved in translation (DUF1610 family)
MKKKPRFFCDNCGTEVSAQTDKCPRCGRYFASIRCPKCGFSGDEGVFDKGCPVCGYSNPLSKNKKEVRPDKNDGAPAAVAATVPSWLFVIAAAFLVLIFALLLNYVTR